MPTMTQVAKKILVTCALPYANGSIHLGHMLEHIQADVWVRYQGPGDHRAQTLGGFGLGLRTHPDSFVIVS